MKYIFVPADINLALNVTRCYIWSAAASLGADFAFTNETYGFMRLSTIAYIGHLAAEHIWYIKISSLISMASRHGMSWR